MSEKMHWIGVSDYYRFPFDNPSGIAYDLMTGDPTPYHRLAEDEVVVFIKSHHRGFDNVLLRLDQEAFLEGYR